MEDIIVIQQTNIDQVVRAIRKVKNVMEIQY